VKVQLLERFEDVVQTPKLLPAFFRLNHCAGILRASG
jgi:hypothetical protein